MNTNIILRCLVQNLTEDAILTRWNVILSLINGTRDETFILTLLRILTNTQQLRDQIDMTLVSLVFDYLHVLMHIMENDENGLVLVLLIEQFIQLSYISVLHLAELIVYDRIEIMLILDQQTLNKQLLSKYLPLALQILSIIKSIDIIKEDFNNLNCSMDITQKIDGQMLKNVTCKK
ncbi:unnamed protein product [Rotaria sp. Silwood2]|nr:unnamed protein product [Rotaria sp. Silwood2]